MKTSTRIRSALTTLLSSLALGVSACPMPGEGMPPMPPMLRGEPPSMPMMHLLHTLKLTDAQQDQLFAHGQAQTKARHEAMRDARKTLDALRALAQSDKFDADTARTLAREHGRQVAEISFLNAQAEAQLRATLTAEQRRQFDATGKPDPRGQRGGPDRHDGNACRGMKDKD